jgi:replicative DNA helicase
MAFNAAHYFRTTDRPEDQNKQVAFFSLEMSAEQLATRILAERSKISSHDIRTGRLSNDDFGRMVQASTEMHGLPLHIDDTPAVTVSAIRTRARRLARQKGLGMIVIDYLQLIASSRSERSENRVQEISNITRGLKALAKDLNVPVLALSQLSRAVEQREDKRPQLADLRESGTIEQDSDVVMFVFREQYYLERAGEPIRRPDEKQEHFDTRYSQWREDCERAHNIAEVIIGKQRHGPIGMVKLHFEAQFTHFSDHVDTSALPEME